MSDTSTSVEGYVTTRSLELPASRGMQFSLEAGVGIVFHRYQGRNDAFTIEGSETVSPEWAIGLSVVKEIISREDFARFKREFGV